MIDLNAIKAAPEKLIEVARDLWHAERLNSQARICEALAEELIEVASFIERLQSELTAERAAARPAVVLSDEQIDNIGYDTHPEGRCTGRSLRAFARSLLTAAGNSQGQAAQPEQQPVAEAGPRQFRKKPVVIQAVKWTGNNLREIIEFTDGRAPDAKSDFAGMMWDQYTDLVAADGLKIFTLEGKMLANIGDWVIRGVKGEFYPCKPDIFDLTYEPAAPVPAAAPEPLEDAKGVRLTENQRRAASLFGCWWSMVQAERDLAETPIDPEAVVLHFMGCGASCMVHAKDLTEISGLMSSLLEAADPVGGSHG